MPAKAGDLTVPIPRGMAPLWEPLATQIRVYARNTLCGREYTISRSPESQDPHPSIFPELEGMAACGRCSLQGHQVLLVITHHPGSCTHEGTGRGLWSFQSFTPAQKLVPERGDEVSEQLHPRQG